MLTCPSRDHAYAESPRLTQCRNCQSSGHYQSLCRDDIPPKCAVCAHPHLTNEHKCASCKGGPKCTHPPIRCANCGQGHKAFDPACPSCSKLLLTSKPPAPAVPIVIPSSPVVSATGDAMET